MPFHGNYRAQSVSEVHRQKENIYDSKTVIPIIENNTYILSSTKAYTYLKTISDY